MTPHTPAPTAASDRSLRTPDPAAGLRVCSRRYGDTLPHELTVGSFVAIEINHDP